VEHISGAKPIANYGCVVSVINWAFARSFTQDHGSNDGTFMSDNKTDADTAFDAYDVTTKLEARNGKLLVVRSQDVAPYLKANAEERNSHSDWRPYASRKGSGTLRKVAEIPNIIVEQWLKEGIDVFSQDPAMQRRVRWKLDSNEFLKLRTMPGKMGVRTRHF
jgi:hypothetical protein